MYTGSQTRRRTKLTSVNAGHHNKVKDFQTEIGRPITVPNENSERTAYDWRNEVKTEAKLHTHQDKFMDMMVMFASTVVGHLDGVRIAMKRIELKWKDYLLIPCELYWAGPRAPKLKKTDIDKMLKIEL